MSASLIGRMRSSAFRLSTITVSRSLASTRFSSESAPGPCMGLFESSRVTHFYVVSFLVRSRQACSRDDNQRGARFRARLNRATTLYAVGPKTRTTMQSCASAAKLRSGGPILPIGMKAKGLAGNPPPRTVIGIPSQGPKQSGRPQRPPIIVPDAKRPRPVQRPAARTATGRSVACVPRPRSWACGHRERSPCERDTTALRRCPSGTLEIATPTGSCLAELDHCRNGLTLSPGVFCRSRRVSQ